MRFWPADRMRQLAMTAWFLFIWIMESDVWSWSANGLSDHVLFLLYLFLVLVGISDYRMRYWKFDADALVSQTSLRRQTLPYSEIVRVSPRTKFGWFEFEKQWTIEYVRNGLTRRIHVNPLKTESFLSTLRDRAIHAVFENSPLPSPPFAMDLGLRAGRLVRMVKW